MIDKDKVKQGMIQLEDVSMDSSLLEVYNVAELFMKGKLIEPMSKEEIEKVINDCFPIGTNYYDIIKKKLAEALVSAMKGKEGK